VTAARRGTCQECGYRNPLRRDGTMGGHQIFDSDGRLRSCEGTGRPPRPLRFGADGRPDCGECLAYLYGQHGAFLAEGIASVAIETGGNPARMLRDYLGAYHNRDHREAA